MGANAVRLIRTDHRRIRELVSRLRRRYRAGAALPAALAGEIAAHSQTCARYVAPFAAERLPELDPAYVASLDRLDAAADQLAQAEDPVPTTVADAVGVAFEDHVAVEERVILTPLADQVTVERLRQLGEAYRRGRDGALKSHPLRGDQHRSRASRAELYERARYRGIEGRSTMSRTELLNALEDQP